ncbi:MAG TPA: F0F1 ATP synthase subunit B [Verrucomicrobiae bacterium]|nr:F0F1 ATP synthase subunit B [Verrucomicrobiae bacterium]
MNQIKQVADTFGVDWSHLIAQVISFVIVCALLYFFAYKRVLAILEARRVRITEGLANAEQIKLELGRTEAQRAEVLAQANEQAARFIEEARRAAARLREEETQKAIAATEQIIAQARRAAEADHARMLAELKREVGRLVVKTTTVVTGKVLNTQDQQRLAEEAAQQISA